jgi:hypothetical protein
VRRQGELLITTQSYHCGQACRPGECFSGYHRDRVEHRQHVTSHAHDTQNCRRRVGQGRGHPGFGRAINLIGKDSKGPVAGYKRNQVVKLRFVGHFVCD